MDRTSKGGKSKEVITRIVCFLIRSAFLSKSSVFNKISNYCFNKSALRNLHLFTMLSSNKIFVFLCMLSFQKQELCILFYCSFFTVVAFIFTQDYFLMSSILCTYFILCLNCNTRSVVYGGEELKRLLNILLIRYCLNLKV